MRHRAGSSPVFFIAVLAIARISCADPVDMPRAFNIPPQPLDGALLAFAEQAGAQVSVPAGALADRTSKGAIGELAAPDALGNVLDQTGLQYNAVTAHTYSITDQQSPVPPADGDSREAAAPAEQAVSERGEPAGDDTPRSAAEASKGLIGSSRDVQAEVIVTGTHIRGAQPASPVLVFGREDFERAGAATAEQFLATIPQNFGGGASEDTTNDLRLQANSSFGTAVNLRGLGSSSTLVLIDGKRSAVAGLAEFVDVSMIPLSAVERIEVMTDGASAIYGSDAIGGVVNFIMRRGYEGAETTARYGATTRGGAEERHAAQSFGLAWDTGSALLSSEYYGRKALSTLDRRFSRETASPLDGPLDLVPKQDRKSLYLTANQDLSQTLRTSASLMYSDRNANYTDWNPAGNGSVTPIAAETKQSAASMGAILDLGEHWQAEVTGGISQIETTVITTSTTNVLTRPTEYLLWSADAKLSGNLLDLPSGSLKFATGGSYRNESYDSLTVGLSGVSDAPPQKTYYSRAIFAETLIPVVASRAASNMDPLVLLTLAARYEKYGTFGSTFDPKYGVRWSPSDQFAMRATYGTSFKAPNAWQLTAHLPGRNLSNVVDPVSPTGRTRTLVRTGRNAELQPETATNLTVGFEWSPHFLTGFRAELTYFDVAYEDRISGFTIASAAQLADPNYRSTVIRRGDIPDADFDALVTRILGTDLVIGCSPPNPSGPCTEPVANVSAILDRRLTNLAGTRTRGLDWILAQSIDSDIGTFELNLNTSYLIENSRQVSRAAQLTETLNTAGNPVDLRVRAGASWIGRRWSVSGFLNYTNGYDNEGTMDLGTRTLVPPAEIDSWTTVDLSVQYDTGHRWSDWVSDIALSLVARNVLDEDPPSYEDGAFGLGYDPANADPLGRVVSLTVTKNW